MKVIYKGRQASCTLVNPKLSKEYKLKKNETFEMPNKDFKILMTSGDNSRVFVSAETKVSETKEAEK